MSNPNLAAYYRLGDAAGSYSVIDSSGNGATGSLIAGIGGVPAYGYAGAFLYDPNTAADMSAGTNAPNGGFSTVDHTTQPPTIHQPLGGALAWTVEMWIKYTSTTGVTPGASFSFYGTTSSGSGLVGVYSIPPGVNIGDLITGPNIPANTTVAGFITSGGQFPSVVISQVATGSGANTFVTQQSTVGYALFSSASVNGPNNILDIRVGAVSAGASVTGYNRVSMGLTDPAAEDVYIPTVYSSGVVNVLDGAWHQVAVSFGASVASIYTDGFLDVTTTIGGTSGGFYIRLQDITVGCDAGPVNGWPGAIQDVSLSTVALTASQIANHYQIGRWFQMQEYGASVGSTNAGRFNKLMAVEGLNSSQMLNVPYPFRTLMYSETNSVTTTSGLNYLQTMSETEPGLIFQGPNGIIQALSRQYQYLAPAATTSQGIFGDSNAASVQLHYDGPSFALVQDDLDVWNNIQVQSGRSGSQLQQAGPTTFPLAAQSASTTGSRTLQGLTSLQFQNDSDALAVAENYLQWYAIPVKRVVGISVNSWGNNGNNIPQMLQRGLYDRLTVQYQGQTPGPQFSQDSLIESIAHSVNIANGPTWATTWAMSPYEILETPFIFGASVGSASNQLAGAASVTGSGTTWILHPATNYYLSGTVSLTVSAGSASVAYNATASQVQTALASLVPSTTCSGGPLNSSTVSVTFGSSQSSFTAYFSPSQVLTL